MIAHKPGNPALAHDHLGEPARRLQHILGDRSSLGLVGVEQAVAGAAADDECELPGQVLGVADSGVHTLTTERAVDVRGVAGQQDASASVGIGKTTLDPEGRRPLHGADRSARLGAPDAHRGNSTIPSLLWLVAELRRSRRHQPPKIVSGQRERGEKLGATHPGRCRIVWPVEVGVHVGEQKPFDERHAGEPDVHRLADDAVGAVGADHPVGFDIVAVVEAHGYPVEPGVEPDDATTPFDRSAEFGHPFAQLGFDLGLRDDQAFSPAQPLHGQPDLQLGQLTTLDGDHHLVDRQRALRQIAERAEAIENLHTAWLQTQRARGRRGPGRACRAPSPRRRPPAARMPARVPSGPPPPRRRRYPPATSIHC